MELVRRPSFRESGVELILRSMWIGYENMSCWMEDSRCGTGGEGQNVGAKVELVERHRGSRKVEKSSF